MALDLAGVGAASVVLIAIVAAHGPALNHIPISTLRFVGGPLLLAFGVQWLRKAILRAGGFKPLHDETAAFAREREQAGAAAPAAAKGMDWYSFTVAFKSVLLEGLEVAFIVIGFGSAQGSSDSPPAPPPPRSSSSWRWASPCAGRSRASRRTRSSSLSASY